MMARNHFFYQQYLVPAPFSGSFRSTPLEAAVSASAYKALQSQMNLFFFYIHTDDISAVTLVPCVCSVVKKLLLR